MLLLVVILFILWVPIALVLTAHVVYVCYADVVWYVDLGLVVDVVGLTYVDCGYRSTCYTCYVSMPVYLYYIHCEYE